MYRLGMMNKRKTNHLCLCHCATLFFFSIIASTTYVLFPSKKNIFVLFEISFLLVVLYVATLV